MQNCKTHVAFDPWCLQTQCQSPDCLCLFRPDTGESEGRVALSLSDTDGAEGVLTASVLCFSMVGRAQMTSMIWENFLEMFCMDALKHCNWSPLGNDWNTYALDIGSGKLSSASWRPAALSFWFISLIRLFVPSTEALRTSICCSSLIPTQIWSKICAELMALQQSWQRQELKVKLSQTFCGKIVSEMEDWLVTVKCIVCWGLPLFCSCWYMMTSKRESWKNDVLVSQVSVSS